MNREEIVMVCAPDISGQVRGKSFPLADLERRSQRGIGWVPTNIQITTFNSIADSPFGSLGDLLMVPDPETEVRVDFGDGAPCEHFFLGNIFYTDGSPWECCLRGRLAEALAALRAETGLDLNSAFELEFQFLDDSPGYGPGFSLTGLRKKKHFGEVYLAALRQAGVEPDSFLREWADRQYEVTMHPQLGIKAADHALSIRELARATAERLPFPDASFDALTFTYLLRYVADPAACMRELVRALRPGGRIGMVEFGRPRRLAFPPWWLYTRVALPAADENEFSRLLSGAGLVDVRTERHSLGGGLLMWGRRP